MYNFIRLAVTKMQTQRREETFSILLDFDFE